MSEEVSSSPGSGSVRPGRFTVIAFLLVALFAGGNPVAVRFSNFGLPPFWGAGTRMFGAALVFWVLYAVRRPPLPKGRALAGAILYGVIGYAAALAFLYWGLVRTPAHIGGAVLALVPLLTLFFASVHGLERPSWRGVLGGVLATAGVGVGAVAGFGGTVDMAGLLALVAGAACIAEASIVFKLFSPGHPLAVSPLGLTVGTPLVLILSRLAGEQWSLPHSLNTWLAFAYLVLFGSVAVFSLNLYVLSRWAASAASYAFLLIPVATVLIAAWLLGERITALFLIGVALVALGVWIGAIHRAPKTVESACAEMPNKGLC